MKDKTNKLTKLALGIACIFLGSGCSKSPPPQIETRIHEKVAELTSQVKPLQPLFVAALSCLKSCSGQIIKNGGPASAISLPNEFKDFIESTDYGYDGLKKILTKFPDNYKYLAIKDPNESELITLGGWVGYVMDYEGSPIHIYVQSGYRQVDVIDPIYTRPEGSLTIAVNPNTKAMAAIFNGQSDLSEYRFSGDERLLSILLAYEVAHEAETEKANLVSKAHLADDVVFPVPSDRMDRTTARLVYLNSLYVDGVVLGAKSAFDAGENARKTPPEKQWWTVNSSFSSCFETGGPAQKLDEFVGFADKPRTQDFRDSSGKIVKVEVINSNGREQDIVWTYYKTQAHCEAEQVNATQSLADRYR